jgi:hypothetical protein
MKRLLLAVCALDFFCHRHLHKKRHPAMCIWSAQLAKMIPNLGTKVMSFKLVTTGS